MRTPKCSSQILLCRLSALDGFRTAIATHSPGFNMSPMTRDSTVKSAPACVSGRGVEPRSRRSRATWAVRVRSGTSSTSSLRAFMLRAIANATDSASEKSGVTSTCSRPVSVRVVRNVAPGGRATIALEATLPRSVAEVCIAPAFVKRNARAECRDVISSTPANSDPERWEKYGREIGFSPCMWRRNSPSAATYTAPAARPRSSLGTGTCRRGGVLSRH